MNRTNPFSGEQLQAFVDGQLDGPDRARVLLALEESDALRRQVAELRRLKDMVQAAYEDVPELHRASTSERRWGGLAVAAAAGALLTLALTQLIDWGLRGSAESARMVADGGITPARAAAPSPEMVMFHIATSDESVAVELLDQVELVASQYHRWGRPLRIVVVANNGGLRLYQAGDKPNARRIEELFARYDNITFAACGNTLNRLADSGERPQLLPQAIVVDSGVAEIARRQKQGWKYIRI